ncbi:hypothetical protein E3P99_02010 [Wallemia hederae]|uniref:C2H2-type domain-containing protein n=1 Tax=Wallemia hederae TaxID=1540922 RepID=A0A4T0FMH9_9BASI|nr:hypothetical protein E3P99_02010 [Wallemia hederae]
MPISDIEYLRSASHDIANSTQMWYPAPNSDRQQNTFSVHAEPSAQLLQNVNDIKENGSEEDAAYDEDGVGDDSMSALPPAMRPTVGPIFQDQTLGFRMIESPDNPIKNENVLARRANFPAYDQTKYNTAEEAMAHALSQVPDQTDPRPFKCPNPECSKTWKNRNGLKYHINHGNCNGVLKTLSRDEAAVSERPYACPVPGCNKRWKNANGFRYHMDHSGAHGRSARRLHEASGGFAGKSNLQSITTPQPKVPKGTRRSSRRSSRRIQYEEDEEAADDDDVEEEDDYGDEEDDDDDDDDVEEEDDDAYDDDSKAFNPAGPAPAAAPILPTADQDVSHFAPPMQPFNGDAGTGSGDGKSFEVNPAAVDAVNALPSFDTAAQEPVIGDQGPLDQSQLASLDFSGVGDASAAHTPQ